MKANNEFQTVRIIDDLNRVIIPHNLRKQLNWETDVQLTLVVSKMGIEFLTQEGGEYSLDAFGRIVLSNDLMETMGWNAGDEVVITSPVVGNGVMLSR